MARLFIAVPVSEEVRASARVLMADLGPIARWVKPEKLHVTLRFLGETPPPSLDVVSGGPFDLAFEGLGSFPGVIWAGVTEGAERLSALAEALGPQDRPYKAHLTLGREAQTLPHVNFRWSCRAEKVVLYESRGGEYFALQERRL